MLLSTLQASAFSVAMLSLVYWPLERMWPARKQPWLRKSLGTDFLFLFGQHLVWSVLALSFLTIVDAQVHGALPKGLREAFLSLPRWAQLVGIVLLGDFAVYWFHRACHRFDFLWRFHAVHHSSETLDWVAAHREHPIDGLLTQLTLNLPAILLGFPVEGLAGLAVFRGLYAIFIHSNVRLPLGWLRYVIGAPELHHWHHAKAPGVVANYGNLSPWTDLVFGTFYLPPAGEETWELGVPERLPKTWPGLLVSPFKQNWTETSGLLRGRVLGPLTLAALVAITFTALSAKAAKPDAGAPPSPDAGINSILAPSDQRYLPATKSFGGTLGTRGLGGLGLRGSGSGAGIGGIEQDVRATPADVVVVGAMDKAIIRRVMQRNLTLTRRCADFELANDGGIAGKVVVRFVIAATGTVMESKVIETTANNPRLEQCLANAVLEMKFPQSNGGGSVIVTWPFRFELVAQ